MDRTKVASVVARQLPEFVREDYPTFVAFVEAYYEYLQNQGVDLTAAKDLDNTMDEFIQYFKKELAPHLPNIVHDERFILQHIRDQYLAKGSAASYKLLFRLLFGKNVELFYPGEQMLRASDGRWNQEISLFAQIDYGIAEDVVGKLVDVVTQNRVLRVLVDRKEDLVGEVERIVAISGKYEALATGISNSTQITVLSSTNLSIGQMVVGTGIQNGTRIDNISGLTITLSRPLTVGITNEKLTFSNQIYEFYLDKKFYGSVKAGDKIKYKDQFQATILPATQHLTVSQPGKNFRVGQVFELQSGSGTGALMKVTGTDNNGGIKYAEFIKFGIGYSSDFAVSVLASNTVTSTGASTASTSSRVGNNLYINDRLLGFNEQGYINKANVYDLAYADGTYAGDIVREFALNYKNAQIESDEPAILTVNLGTIVKYPGYYTSNNGFLDDSIKIQDSKYYQAFSYVIKIDERLSTYKSAVKTMIHPAGMALFAEFNINNNFDLSVALECLVKALGIGLEDEFFMVDSGATLKTTKGLSDSITTPTDSLKYNMGKSLADSITTPSDSNTLLFGKSLADSINTPLDTTYTFAIGKSLSDDYSGMLDAAPSFAFSKAVSDAAVMSDDDTLSIGKALADSIATPSDSAALLTTKAVSDSISTPLDSTYTFVIGKSLSDDYSGAVDSSPNFSFGKGLSDSQTTSDSTTLSTTKYVLDTSVGTFSNTGKVWLNPYQGQDFYAEEYSVGLSATITA